MQFGAFLKFKRNNQDLTQPQAADLIGIEQSYLSKLENNKAIPSAEIFEKLQSSYGFSVAEVHEQVDKDDLKRLEEIVLVKAFLVKHSQSEFKSYKRLMFISVLLLMVGSAIFTYGILLKDNVNTAFIYESKGVIKDGESLYIFAELPNYNLFNVQMKHQASKEELSKHPMFERINYDQIIYSTFRGNFFDLDVENGSRRYFLIDSRETSMPTPFYLGVSFGVMLIIGGLLGIILGKKSNS